MQLTEFQDLKIMICTVKEAIELALGEIEDSSGIIFERLKSYQEALTAQEDLVTSFNPQDSTSCDPLQMLSIIDAAAEQLLGDVEELLIEISSGALGNSNCSTLWC